jgi:hypothetical protein
VIITLSWPRISALLREFHNMPDAADDEIAVRLTAYARAVFDECASRFGVRVGELSEPATQSVAHFFCDISGARDTGAAHGVDWARLLGGLQWLRVIACTVTADDWQTYCDRYFGAAMEAAHDQIAENLTRIGVEELRATVEAWVGHVCWSQPDGGNGLLEQNPALQELYARSALGLAGVRDPLEKINEYDEAQAREVRMYQEQQQAARDKWFEENRA